jgi:hypothetical protein
MSEWTFHPARDQWRALVNTALNLKSSRFHIWRGICRRAERLYASQAWCCSTETYLWDITQRNTHTHIYSLFLKKKTSPCTVKRGKYNSSPSSQTSPFSSRNCQTYDASRFLHRRVGIGRGGEKRFLLLEFSSFNLVSLASALPLPVQLSISTSRRQFVSSLAIITLPISIHFIWFRETVCLMPYLYSKGVISRTD